MSGIVDGLRSVGWQRLTAERRRPEVIRWRSNACRLAVAGVAAVCSGAFMGQLDAGIVTVTLPTLQRTFHSSVGTVTWVGLSYQSVLVALAVAMAVATVATVALLAGFVACLRGSGPSAHAFSARVE